MTPILIALALAAAPVPLSIGDGIWLIPGGFPEKRQPDGNTVIFAGKSGLIVMDTGRHAWQRQAILDFATGQKRPIVAIVNSHWHLDHVSGNPALKVTYPELRVYASDAIDGALHGFLPKSAADAQAYLDSGQVPPETAEDIRNDMATLKNGEALKPDIVISTSRTYRIDGRDLDLHLASDAATAGDVWVYDPQSRVLASGDLVTLPVPFLDTACTAGWRTALDEILATPFETLVPGHGRPMTRTQFTTWQVAFYAFVDCAKSDRADCASAWLIATAELRDPGDEDRAQAMAGYYIDLLRHNGGDSPWCKKAG